MGISSFQIYLYYYSAGIHCRRLQTSNVTSGVYPGAVKVELLVGVMLSSYVMEF